MHDAASYLIKWLPAFSHLPEIKSRAAVAATLKVLLEVKKDLAHIARRITSDFDGSASASQIKKSFKHNTTHKKAIEDALEDMESSEMLEREYEKTGGRPKWVYRLKEQ